MTDTLHLSVQIDQLGLDEVEWEALGQEIGLAEPYLTNAQTASPPSARSCEKLKAHLKDHFSALAQPYQTLDAAAGSTKKPGQASSAELFDWCQRALRDAGWRSVNSDSIVRLLLVFRVVADEQSIIIEWFPYLHATIAAVSLAEREGVNGIISSGPPNARTAQSDQGATECVPAMASSAHLQENQQLPPPISETDEAHAAQSPEAAPNVDQAANQGDGALRDSRERDSVVTPERPRLSDDPNFTRLAALIYAFGINRDIWRHVDLEFSRDAEEHDRLLHLDELMDLFDLSPRAWLTLELRMGFDKRRSHDEVGEVIGATRARAHQIYKRAFGKFVEGMPRAILPFSILEDQLGLLDAPLPTPMDVNVAVVLLQTLLLDFGWEADGRSIRQLLLALRTLVREKRFGLERRLPQLSRYACVIPPVVVEHSRLAAEQREQERHWTYSDLAKAVLEAAAEPLHYTEVAQRAEEFGRHEGVSLKGIHNVLLANPDTFALVEPGTYGLTARGHKGVDPYVSIIADVLRTARKPLSSGDLSHRVNAVRPIKSQTFQMTVDLNPRFYRSQEGTYGLRAWLPPREKQTLRTPAWQVEDKDSFERVAKSVERGYDVEGIVAQDQGAD